ncbi:hypothetical protein NDU88_004430 [Pleurodeles waltl]|uniref:Uncharacterized protein n=1 Tax=Pleurodeles waltl TaxID=8319 RepID=A0AAV7VIQ9_PLEWA|nr:hypothetical protein NDU88_004430 [Pleurodeles waltl]
MKRAQGPGKPGLAAAEAEVKEAGDLESPGSLSPPGSSSAKRGTAGDGIYHTAYPEVPSHFVLFRVKGEQPALGDWELRREGESSRLPAQEHTEREKAGALREGGQETTHKLSIAFTNRDIAHPRRSPSPGTHGFESWLAV